MTVYSYVCRCFCMCAYHTYMYAHLAYMCIPYTYVCTHTIRSVCVYVYVYANVCIHTTMMWPCTMHMCVSVCIHTTWPHTCVHVCLHICALIECEGMKLFYSWCKMEWKLVTITYHSVQWPQVKLTLVTRWHLSQGDNCYKVTVTVPTAGSIWGF